MLNIRQESGGIRSGTLLWTATEPSSTRTWKHWNLTPYFLFIFYFSFLRPPLLPAIIKASSPTAVSVLSPSFRHTSLEHSTIDHSQTIKNSVDNQETIKASSTHRSSRSLLSNPILRSTELLEAGGISSPSSLGAGHFEFSPFPGSSFPSQVPVIASGSPISNPLRYHLTDLPSDLPAVGREQTHLAKDMESGIRAASTPSSSRLESGEVMNLNQPVQARAYQDGREIEREIQYYSQQIKSLQLSQGKLRANRQEMDSTSFTTQPLSAPSSGLSSKSHSFSAKSFDLEEREQALWNVIRSLEDGFDPAVSPRSGPSPNNKNIRRYKTELCENYRREGRCRYFDRCQFAHGLDDLRPRRRHPKHQTEICRTFQRTGGNCPYHLRCW